MLKFIYSEKATNFCEISTVYLSYVVIVKSTVEISKIFVAFSEYMNFTICFSSNVRVKLVSTHSVHPARGRANYGTKWGHSARPPTYSLLPSQDNGTKLIFKSHMHFIHTYDFTKHFLNLHPCFTEYIFHKNLVKFNGHKNDNSSSKRI